MKSKEHFELYECDSLFTVLSYKKVNNVGLFI